MPENVECTECGTRVLGVVVDEVRPLKYEACPECGGVEFRSLVD